jgi:ring-1,2-phenylacetyl-CoA epoxidase subunit PaaD
MLATLALEKRIWEALETVQDPELPISVTDLGLIQEVTVNASSVRVRMIPTYSACPAIEVMRHDIRRRLLEIPGIDHVEVQLSFERPWTMDRMSERGRAQLVQHGLSMPSMRRLEPVECPFCGSTNTVLENLFGPTLCRAIYYCSTCKNPIERFKSPT